MIDLRQYGYSNLMLGDTVYPHDKAHTLNFLCERLEDLPKDAKCYYQVSDSVIYSK